MIKVTDEQGNEHQLQGRLKLIVMAVIENAGEIAKPINAQVIFDCAGKRVSPSIRKALETSRPEA
jgi:hypothetical protein